MDIQTKDGILLRNIPDGTPDEEIKARINKIRAEKGVDVKSEDQSRQPPGSEPLSYKGMMMDSLGNVVKSALQRGLLGGVASMAGEGLGNVSKLMERGGYKAGGAVTDLVAPYVPAEVAGGIGYATNVGVQSIPAVLGAYLGSMSGAKAGEALGKRTMQSALKPPKADLMSGDADRAIKTMLERGVNVTAGGEAKLQGMIDKLNNQVEKLIATSTDTVSKTNAAKEINKIIDVFRSQVNPSSDVKAIIKSWDEFNRTVPRVLPIQRAQALKQGTYKALKNKAFSGELKSAETEAQKALARGLKQSIEEKIPAVGPINKEMGELINALRMVENRAGMAGNLNLTGLSGAAMNPKVAAMMMADRSSLFKSLLARALYQGGGATGAAIGGTAGALAGNQMGD